MNAERAPNARRTTQGVAGGRPGHLQTCMACQPADWHDPRIARFTRTLKRQLRTGPIPVVLGLLAVCWAGCARSAYEQRARVAGVATLDCPEQVRVVHFGGANYGVSGCERRTSVRIRFLPGTPPTPVVEQVSEAALGVLPVPSTELAELAPPSSGQGGRLQRAVESRARFDFACESAEIIGTWSRAWYLAAGCGHFAWYSGGCFSFARKTCTVSYMGQTRAQGDECGGGSPDCGY